MSISSLRPRSSGALAGLLLLLWLLVPAGPSAAQEGTTDAETQAAPSPLRLVSVDVQPDEPTPDTLCKLSVTLANDADRPMSALRFAVTVNGHPVPVYEKQVFLDVVPPGGEVEVPLYNFWVTETGRPLPAKGPLTVEVEVTDARWVKREMEPMDPAASGTEGQDGSSESAQPAEQVETWTLLESLESLPRPATATRPLKRPSSGP